jgi:hypothetical protein
MAVCTFIRPSPIYTIYRSCRLIPDVNNATHLPVPKGVARPRHPGQARPNPKPELTKAEWYQNKSTNKIPTYFNVEGNVIPNVRCLSLIFPPWDDCVVPSPRFQFRVPEP